ncbi:hypothetical protein P152DRAFT_12438 [Eremomyces bilateralis CBS 781.70]|uniref:Uncharacterized protein n=1 Tax=Eremomyces bilateralis CBS 781.70 TaxID=1392243 RepID=A0A6G1GGP1_9PEZI|nr:uncharacterized protein P152DRAFT_12438 [Eremomyces bilateralis CBS 781.70]KAF1817238.1 hypothetical protein P152DRAFT_12438 [Eremomyces bilateralis CBS 781.70]
MMHLNMVDATHRFSMDGAAYDHTMDNMGWPNETTHQRLDDFDWENIDPLDVGFYDRSHDSLSSGLMGLTPTSKEQTFDHQTPQLNLDIFQPATQTAPPFPANFTSTLAPSPISRLSSSSTLFSSSKCRCREDLAVLLPEVSDAMQGKQPQLDKIYKMTQKVIQGCQDIVDCTGCQIGCTDLICMVAIFQRTDACFEYIANADQDSSIPMSFGGLDVPINDPKLRAMLVMNLIQQATMVLDAVSIKGQDMLRALGAPSALAQTNIDYLETVIRDFREVLRKAAEFAN